MFLRSVEHKRECPEPSVGEIHVFYGCCCCFSFDTKDASIQVLVTTNTRMHLRSKTHRCMHTLNRWIFEFFWIMRDNDHQKRWKQEGTSRIVCCGNNICCMVICFFRLTQEICRYRRLCQSTHECIYGHQKRWKQEGASRIVCCGSNICCMVICFFRLTQERCRYRRLCQSTHECIYG